MSVNQIIFSRREILLEISPEHYDRLAHGISERSSLYAVLKNGVVLHHTEAGTAFRMIEMLYEKFHARMRLTLAEKLCPEAVPQIEKGIRLANVPLTGESS
jgi:hypothetical protein